MSAAEPLSSSLAVPARARRHEAARSLRWPAVLLLLALLAPLADPADRQAATHVHAHVATGQDVRSASVGDVEATAVYSWPQTLSEGWFPVQVSLVNQSGEHRVVHLEATGGGFHGQVLVRAEVELAPGASGSVELLCEASPSYSSEYHVVVRAGGSAEVLPALGPSNHPGRSLRSAHLVVPAPGTDSATVERWRSLLKESVGQRHELGALAGFDELSRWPAAYSSLASVTLDASGGLPDAERLEALLSWARTGGRLALYGAGAEAAARAHPHLSAWMQDRFRGPGEGFRAWNLGHGLLLIGGSDAPFERAAQRARLAGDRMQDRSSAGLGLDRLPLRSLTVLLVLFAVLIGPVNFILVRRSGRPTLLLVTVPGIALAASVLLVLYATFAQGLDVRSASDTWTVLDQRLALASTREARTVFAGSSPGPGLRPAAGTTVLPPVEADHRRAGAGRRVVDLRGGLLLGGDHLRVRVEQQQRLMSDRPSRARLDVRTEGGDVVVTNALGAMVLDLVLRLEDGSLHQLEGDLEEGASRTLQAIALGQEEEWPPIGLFAGRRWWAGVAGRRWWEGTALPPATYLARLDRSPFSDDCGISMREIAGNHSVLGVLAGPEDGR